MHGNHECPDGVCAKTGQALRGAGLSTVDDLLEERADEEAASENLALARQAARLKKRGPEMTQTNGQNASRSKAV